MGSSILPMPIAVRAIRLAESDLGGHAAVAANMENATAAGMAVYREFILVPAMIVVLRGIMPHGCGQRAGLTRIIAERRPHRRRHHYQYHQKPKSPFNHCPELSCIYP